jgi:curved DNA-binding protein CbpA
VNPESLSRDAFNAAFYQLARRYHPDVNPGAAELMANINNARRTILDSYRRA